MSKNVKLQPVPKGRWAIGRIAITGELISLIEGYPVIGEEEILVAFLTLGIKDSEEARRRFFPKNVKGESCPTFELISMWYDLKPASIADTKDKV